MSKHVSLSLCLGVLAIAGGACGSDPEAGAGAAETSDGAIEQAYVGNLTLTQAQSACRCELELVPISGTVFHFGLDVTQSPPTPFPSGSTVSGAQVWLAEAPITRSLKIRSDQNGRWSVNVIKVKNRSLSGSFVYELAGYTTTKSQVFDVGNGGVTDLSVQFPMAAYYAAAKSQIEQQVGALIGAPYQLSNVVVATVGKSWASTYSQQLPHGDPGATVTIAPAIQFPASVGPIYFNESVSPDPTLTSTSVDGGVLYGNLPKGKFAMTATKAPFSYTTVTFAIQDGIELYVASPPHSIQGTNSSPPGQP